MSFNTKEYVAAYTQVLLDIQNTQVDLDAAKQAETDATTLVSATTEKLAALKSVQVDFQRLLGPQDIGAAEATAVSQGVIVTP